MFANLSLSRVSVIVLGGALGSFLCACSSGETDGTDPVSPTLQSPLGNEPLRSTTDPAIARSNLDAQIQGMERQLEVLADAGAHERFFDLLSMRVQFFGTFSDFSKMEELVSDAEAAAVPGHTLLRARFLAAVHEFDAAVEQLEDAGSATPEDGSLRRVVDLARQERLGLWLEETRAAAEAYPSFATLSELATVQSALGDFSAADESYQAALNAYRDASPFPLAWANFQRGLMWSESAGDDELGERYYRRALAYLPDYVTPRVHLGELLLDQGLEEEALTHFFHVAEAEDPEPAGKLASYFKTEDPALSSQFSAKAAERYCELFEIYEFAFLDHGSEFFAGPGEDAGLAVELAMKNLEVRRTPRSYLVALNAAWADGNDQLLCRWSTEASMVADRHPVLDEAIAEASEACAE